MNAILSFLIKTLPGSLAKLILGLIAPSLRQLNINGVEMQPMFANAASLYLGTTPTYVAVGAYTAADVQDVSESIHELLVAALTELKVTLAAPEVASLLSHISSLLPVKFPAV